MTSSEPQRRTDEDTGDVITMCPLAGWQGLILPLDAIALCLEFGESEEAIARGEVSTMRFSMTRTEARELARYLLNAAETPYR
jgi:hypothetical protein